MDPIGLTPLKTSWTLEEASIHILVALVSLAL